MPPGLTTPGVFISELNTFPNSIVVVDTCIPVFVGYTETAGFNEQSVLNVPTRITNLSDYENFFGKGFKTKFKLEKAQSNDDSIFLNGVPHNLTVSNDQRFYLYNSIRLFYANGGSNCYILSLDTYGNKPQGIKRKDTDFIHALDVISGVNDITLVVMPDATTLQDAYANVYTKVLKHCAQLQSRFAIFDLFQHTSANDFDRRIADFRSAIGNEFLDYGAAYFPWLNTTIVQRSEVDFENIDIDGINQLKDYLPEPQVTKIFSNANSTYNDLLAIYSAVVQSPVSSLVLTDEEVAKIASVKNNFQQSLLNISPSYKLVIEHIQSRLNQLPSSGAIAGIYSTTDNLRGVWTAPANVGLSAVISLLIDITSEQQEKFNIDIHEGKSINVIRSFTGSGTLVWGARTLNGNSNDWRYINVRRSMIMIEQSIKEACRAFVFEKNDSNTWVTVKSMISNFLNSLWKQGGLAGATPGEAFNVEVGLGSTMAAQDILDGYMVVSVKVAIVRPGEFIEITFKQMMHS